MALKHVVLEEDLSATGRSRWSLSGPTGDVAAFRHWQDQITEGLAYESRKAYSIAVAQFIDYLYEASAFSDDALTPKRARELVEGYKTLLEFGERAGSSWLRKVARNLPRKLPIAPASANQKLTAIKGFLDECEDLHDEARELCGTTGPTLYANLVSSTKSNVREAAKIRESSMLSGVIRNAASKLKTRRRLNVRQLRETPWDDTRLEFPLEKIGSVIEAAGSYRDKALYTLLACGGLRTHEALRIKFTWLDHDSLRVDLHDLLYRTPGQEMRSKGRSARYVYFWPGYEELFFQYITRYLLTERRHLARDPHDYLFVKINKGRDIGRPLLEASDKARDDVFKRAQRVAGIQLAPTGRAWGLHSLRHAYGVYMANHCPWGEGYGIPIPLVMRLMGHTEIASTQKYARESKYRIEAVLNAGRTLFASAGLDPKRFREHLAASLIKEAEKLLSEPKVIEAAGQ